MKEFILNNLLLTSAGATAVIFVIVKIIPNKKLAFSLFGLGRKVTDFGRFKLGISFWRAIRKWIVDTLMVSIVNLCGGLGYYDLIEEFDEKGSKMKPPRDVAGLKWNDESKKIIPYFEGDKVKDEDIYKKFGDSNEA